MRPEPFGVCNLVGVARVDAEIHRHLDRLVELGLGPILDHLDRFVDRIKLGAINAFAELFSSFSEICHGPYSATVMPMDRADPATMRIAESTLSQFKSFIFCSAISRTCAGVIEPATSRPGVFEPLSSLAAFLMK